MWITNENANDVVVPEDPLVVVIAARSKASIKIVDADVSLLRNTADAILHLRSGVTRIYRDERTGCRWRYHQPHTASGVPNSAVEKVARLND